MSITDSLFHYMTDRQIDKPRQNVTDLAAVTNVGRSERDTPTFRSRDIVIQLAFANKLTYTFPVRLASFQECVLFRLRTAAILFELSS